MLSIIYRVSMFVAGWSYPLPLNCYQSSPKSCLLLRLHINLTSLYPLISRTSLPYHPPIHLARILKTRYLIVLYYKANKMQKKIDLKKKQAELAAVKEKYDIKEEKKDGDGNGSSDKHKDK